MNPQASYTAVVKQYNKLRAWGARGDRDGKNKFKLAEIDEITVEHHLKYCIVDSEMIVMNRIHTTRKFIDVTAKRLLDQLTMEKPDMLQKLTQCYRSFIAIEHSLLKTDPSKMKIAYRGPMEHAGNRTLVGGHGRRSRVPVLGNTNNNSRQLFLTSLMIKK